MELRDCPFCGGVAQSLDNHTKEVVEYTQAQLARCSDCGSEADIDTWNMRVTPKPLFNLYKIVKKGEPATKYRQLTKNLGTISRIGGDRELIVFDVFEGVRVDSQGLEEFLKMKLKRK